MSDAPSPAPLGLEELVERLAEPEPLCLALLALELRSSPGAPWWPPSPVLVEAVACRLRPAMRPYDELRTLPDGRFAVALPTLAGADALRVRMADLFALVNDPYPMDGTEVRLRILFGAALRAPGEEPTAFLSRVAAAVDAARDLDGRRPVLG